MGNEENKKNKKKELSSANENDNDGNEIKNDQNIKKYNLDMSKRSLSLPVQKTENENIESNNDNTNKNMKLNNEEEDNYEIDLDNLTKLNPKFNGINRCKKLQKDFKIDIDKKNYLTNNDVPMMKTANNFYSKKITFDDNQEKNKNNNTKNNEDDEENEISSFKKISKNFQINNEDNEINQKHNPLYNKNEMLKKKKPTINIDIEENIDINKEIEIKKEDSQNDMKDDIDENLKINKENKENDDLDNNIKINNLIEGNQDKQKNTYLKVETKVIDNYHKDRQKRRMIRYNTLSDLNVPTKTPQKVFLFDNPNLFDLFLIILNHNYYINKYLEKHEKDIEKWDKQNQFFLSGILYYINQYLWKTKPEKIITKEEIKRKYIEFLDCCTQQSCKNQNPQFFLYNMNNIELFICFILRKINQEITTAKGDRQIQYVHTNNIAFDNFKNNFVKNNSSMISAYYIGFFQEETKCMCCQNKMQRYGNYYSPIKNNTYTEFSYISCDLLEIKKQMNLNQRMNSYNCNMNCYQNNNVQLYNNNLNLIYSLGKELNKSNMSYCNLCFMNTQKYVQKKFLVLPKVLTFILKNNDGSFPIDDEIDLSQYCIYPGNYNYYLIAMLCKYTYDNSFIAYCFNQKDGNWYYYTKNEIKVNKAESLDINAIPFVLVYQSVECEELNYKKINLENANNKKGYHFKFQNGFPETTLYFGVNYTVKDVKETIIRLYNFIDVENIKLVINADILKDEDLMCFVASSNSQILVIPITS